MTQIVQLPHYQQTESGYCLPACIRMVLASHGIHRSEPEIARIINAKPYGAPSFAVRHLEVLRVQVDYRSWSVTDLVASLNAGAAVIAFLRTGFLDYWQEDVAHAVVVVGAEHDQHFWVHDPTLTRGPTATLWNGLLAGWAEFSYRGATIGPR